MSMHNEDPDEDDVIVHQFKIILLGDGAVGKTSIATRFTEDKFSQNYKQTIGVDFFIKRINLQCELVLISSLFAPFYFNTYSKSPNSSPDMGYWWTGNPLHLMISFRTNTLQSIGSKMLTSYISGADAVLLVYDITNYESFANLEDWYRLVLKAFEGRPLPYIALCGNKCENIISYLCFNCYIYQL